MIILPAIVAMTLSLLSFGLDPLSFFKEGDESESLGPLFGLLLQKNCFFGGLEFSFYWNNKDFLDVFALLIIPR